MEEVGHNFRIEEKELTNLIEDLKKLDFRVSRVISENTWVITQEDKVMGYIIKSQHLMSITPELDLYANNRS